MTSGQEPLLKVPGAPPLLNATVPCGQLLVPAAWVSVTVTVQVLAWLTKTGLPHDTEVEVERRVTASGKMPPPEALLLAWTSAELPDGL